MSILNIKSPTTTLVGFKSTAAVLILSLCCNFALSDKPTAALDSAFTPTKEQVKATKEIIYYLENRHYTSQNIGDSLSKRLLRDYIDRLDSGRSLFLNDEIKEFKKLETELDDSIKKGDLSPAFSIYNRYHHHLSERIDSIVNNLPKLVESMDFTIEEDIILDRSEEDWAKNKNELDEVWRKRLKNRVLSMRLDGKKDKEIIELLTKRYKNQLNRLKQSNPEDAYQLFINTLTQIYDPHTSYLSPRNSENFNINMSLALEGIGAVLQQEDEYTKVLRLIHAGPAFKQGDLSPSDRIVAVGQGKDGELQDVIGMRLDEVVELIRGKKGTIVQLEVIPASAKSDAERKHIEIKRDKVKLEEQSAQSKVIEVMHDGKVKKIGVIDIPTFYIDFAALRRGDKNYRSTTRDVANLLNGLIKDGVEGIVIDLRENGGGSLKEANALTGLFIESGPSVQIRHATGQIYKEAKVRPSPYYDGPLLVLINRLSASASEIFAGAIQDYQRGLIVGSESFGKGTVQALTELNQGQLKITQSKFYRISGASTQHRGVIPDIIFPSTYDLDQVGESTLDNALLWDKIASSFYQKYYPLNKFTANIQKKHDQRTMKDPDFIYRNEQLALMKEASKIETISLNEKTRKAKELQDKEKALAIENKRRLGKGLEVYKSYDDFKEKTKAEKEEQAKASTNVNRIDETDPYLNESALILLDALPAFNEKLPKQEITKKKSGIDFRFFNPGAFGN